MARRLATVRVRARGRARVTGRARARAVMAVVVRGAGMHHLGAGSHSQGPDPQCHHDLPPRGSTMLAKVHQSQTQTDQMSLDIQNRGRIPFQNVSNSVQKVSIAKGATAAEERTIQIICMHSLVDPKCISELIGIVKSCAQKQRGRLALG
jgi:hypothetical protein